MNMQSEKRTKLHAIITQAFSEAAEKMEKEGATIAEIEAKLFPKMAPAYNNLLETASNDIFEYMKTHMFEASFCHDNETDEFISHNKSIWGEGFAASKTMYIMAVEAAQMHLEHIEDDIDKVEVQESQYKLFSLVSLHGRACQIFLEILELMKGGFADGAYARWRSMFELCCIAQMIYNNDEAVSKQYFEQSETEEKSYAWLKGVLDASGKKIKHFSQIMELCDVDPTWKRQYNLGCLSIHASPQGTFKRLSVYKSGNLIPAGRSDYGITTPAEHSALSLQWITSLLLGIFPNLDSIATSNTIHEWSLHLREIYFRANDNVFDTNNEGQE